VTTVDDLRKVRTYAVSRTDHDAYGDTGNKTCT
jgi:hypothetical protein